MSICGANVRRIFVHSKRVSHSHLIAISLPPLESGQSTDDGCRIIMLQRGGRFHSISDENFIEAAAAATLSGEEKRRGLLMDDRADAEVNGWDTDGVWFKYVPTKFSSFAIHTFGCAVFICLSVELW